MDMLRILGVALSAVALAACEVITFGVLFLLKPLIGEQRVRYAKSYIMVCSSTLL